MHISALEERKRDLLQRVDTIRQTKISTLKAQGERLGQRHTILTEALKVGFSLLSVYFSDSWESRINVLFPYLYLIG